MQAQLIATPAFHENTLVNSPASVGALQQEGIQMSTFSQFLKEINLLSISAGIITINSPPSINQIIPNFNDGLSIFELKRLSSLSYHNTQTLPNNFKVTVGLQMQLTRSSETVISTPNTYGVTTNLHIPLVGDDTTERYFSLGLQMNLIQQNPNRAVTAFTHDNLIQSPTLDTDSFHDQFKNSGFQYTLNLSYLKYKYEKSILAFGFSYSASESKFARFLNPSGSYRFESLVNNTGSLYFNYQLVLSRKSMFDLNFLYNILDQVNVSLGFGFNLKKNKILRFTASRSDDDLNSNTGGTISFEMSRFSYLFHLGSRRQRTNGLFTTVSVFTNSFVRGTFVEFGVKYNMSADAKPSLLNIKY